MDSDAEESYDHLYKETEDAPKHDKLLHKILSLHKIQNLKKPSRTEPSLHISEYDLVKSITGEKGSVQVNELTKPLKNRKSRVKISDNVKKTQKTSHTLPKPLEKPLAKRIRRTVAYEKTRLELDRWEATVTANRISTNLSFPLNDDVKLEAKEAKNFTSMWRVKSKLTEELEKIDSKVEEFHISLEQQGKFPLTMKEMLARRKEAAKLRAYQGYQEAKARRQNKIKSKKYHRIQKKLKIKKKLKEFEELQKTNPEEALKTLEEIEKIRVQERFSLRHKSTGKWAKNQQIRAKYDKESRENLAQQLRLSRELSQKSKINESSSDEEDEENAENISSVDDENNPWISSIKPGKEVADFVSGYRRYWMNENNKKLEETKEVEAETETTDVKEKEISINEAQEVEVQKTKTKTNLKKKKTSKGKEEEEEMDVPKKKTKTNLKKKKPPKGEGEEEIEVPKKKTKTNLKKKKISKGEEEAEIEAPKKKISANNEAARVEEVQKTKTNSKKKKTTANVGQIVEVQKMKSKTNLKKKQPSEEVTSSSIQSTLEVMLNTAVPDLITNDEHDENQRTIISEAFEDDDLIDDFNKDKNIEIDKNKPKDINLNLPGWGSWGGTNIKVNKRKKRRFTLMMPKNVPRKDDSKKFCIINEKAQSKIKEHMVSEVPFPFKTVKDFEASLRAPISNTFQPETAYRKLIKPPVTTKMGTIIEPISKNILVNKQS